MRIEYDAPVTLPRPDLTLFESSIETDPVWPQEEEVVQLLSTVRNTGPGAAWNVRVNFYDGAPSGGGIYLGYAMIPEIAGGGGQAVVSVPWTVQTGRHLFHVQVDPYHTVSELDENNNFAKNTVPILKGYKKYEDGFEFGLGDWVYDFDVPMQHTTGRYRENHLHCTRDEVYKGKQSLFAFLDGTGDDGTVWIERGVPVPRNASLRVTLSFALGVQSDLATTVMGFIDYYNPEVEVDFEEMGMQPGWNVYTFEKIMHTGDSNRLWLGGGFTARWETELRKYMDNFTITITEI
jgi:hypothetical protein